MIEHKFASWTELRQQALVNSGELVFRGQEKYSWTLEPKLVRTLKGAKVPVHEWRTREELKFAHFKLQAKSRGEDLPEDDDLVSWLALMRHYGAPTRLLDWTASFYVAAYFAYSRIKPNGKTDGALWAIPMWTQAMIGHQSFVIDAMGCQKTVTKELDGTETVSYSFGSNFHRRRNQILAQLIGDNTEHFLFVVPEKGFPRLSSQQGYFSCAGTLGFEMHKHVHHYWRFNYEEPAKGGEWLPQEVLTKVRLPWQWRTEVLTDLWRMNINEATLFPGTDGLARSLELLTELNLGQPLTRLWN